MVLIKLHFLTKDIKKLSKIFKVIYCRNLVILHIKASPKMFYDATLDHQHTFDLMYTI